MAPESTTTVSGRDVPGHIHNISLRDGVLLLGTHEGLWSQAPGEQPVMVSRDPFDVMGFTMGGDRWFASGHPGEGMDGPGHLGLIQSTDQGVTWQGVSLAGEVDFHRLVTSGERLLGMNSVDGALLRSDDAGATWTQLGTPPLYDIAVDPMQPDTVVGTTQDGPVRSRDGGGNFEPIQADTLIALLAWDPQALFGVDVDGRVHASTDMGESWEPRGESGGSPLALAAEGERVVVLTGGTVSESIDGGRTFTPRLTDLSGH
ncbi:MAG: exo-alpha-sialidase [Actinomycetota bacterium]|nr:exo-alpha-sialidase [Actinomycetota bacterium]